MFPIGNLMSSLSGILTRIGDCPPSIDCVSQCAAFTSNCEFKIV